MFLSRHSPMTFGTRFLPDLIKGDLDSLRDDAKAYYLEKVNGPFNQSGTWLTSFLLFQIQGVEIIADPDQYTTDLQKCLKSLGDVEKDVNQQVQFPSRNNKIFISSHFV